MTTADAGSGGAPADGRPGGLLRRTDPALVLRYGLAGLWAVDAGLQLQPAMFTRAFPAAVLYANAIMYQPGWLSVVLTRAAALAATHLAALDIGTAVVQLLLALGILWRPTLRLALTASIVWALVVWVFGEGLGAMATGTALAEAGAPGAALLYVPIALAAWPVRSARGAAGAGRGRPGDRRTRLAWTGYWLAAAALHLPLRYPPGAVLAYNLQTAAQVEPGPLAGLDYRLAQIGDAHGVAITAGLAALELLVALAIWAPRRRAAAPIAGGALAAAFWVVGEGMGAAFSGLSTDLGTAPTVLLLAAALLVGSRRGDPATVPGRSRWQRPT